jgi:N-acetylmuramoyl-L-alanine amidase
MFRSRIFLLAILFLGAATTARALDEEPPNELPSDLSTLGHEPDWNQLDQYQGTLTHDEFAHLLHDVYCPHGVSAELIDLRPDEVRILKSHEVHDYLRLHFAKTDADRLPLPRNWTPPSSLGAPAAGKPLSGFRIALDPGHLGGRWAKMEERWFKIGKAAPVQEGDLTLRVAQMLVPRLQSLGAEVSLVRASDEPVTPYRPSDFRDIALQLLRHAGIAKPAEDFHGPADPEKEKSVRWQEELMFYRNSEIRRRADLVNYSLQPDLVLCLHFNAEQWGDPAKPKLVDKNHLHLLVNGSYLPLEVELDDERFEMMRKLLSRSFPEEVDLADSLGLTMAKTTGLPPYHYKTPNVTPVGKSGYVYARNLMATRLYRCPTVYLEPYVMNSHEVFARVEAGDYDGTRKIAGKKRSSIFREYTNGVVDGLLAYFKTARPQTR